MRPTRVTWVGLAALATYAIGAIISIANRMPYDSGGQGNPNNVAGDFLAGNGTALA